jgi:hypothetical protein
MGILRSRYGNMQIIVQSKFKKLEQIPPPNEQKPASVVEFFGFLMNLASTLDTECGRP